MEDDDFQTSIVSRLRFIARERAIRSEGSDEGFTVSISAENIKAETERSRIKKSVLENYSDAFNSAGFSSQIDNENKSIEVFVPAVVDSTRTNFSLDDINEQKDVIQEIRLREEMKYND
ncbi:hypothetical protein [Moritella viscosa]|uniref:Uncharacterized protein yaaN n=1 Tax=Moritella viscosa TaxID=80854 RepID=A0ABY1HCJ2_9GAMM|nr:hypothetical protein [Moritella viscosa]SGY91348.1 Uncharacterized protein yaaN [Moritella viscosa]SGZ17281.1 Uncharacterized protein yaaN [Moritella viscosa]SHO26224.1 Uncharacterized protein yaaN [Moritella viscosa]